MNILHITSGDIAGDILTKSGIPGEVFVWHDILYDGPRNPGWPDDDTLIARSLFLEKVTDGGLDRQSILETLRHQYVKLAEAGKYEHIILWFDACLFDQSMLAHVLTCLLARNIEQVELLCVESFPGIVPFHGLGQLQPDQLASLYDDRRHVTDLQFACGVSADKAFATLDGVLLKELSHATDLPLPWIAAAATRLLQEQPDPQTGLGRLETLAIQAIIDGCEKPGEIFKAVAAEDTPPQYWGDITLWAKINGLAERERPLVRIKGPGNKLPQWKSDIPLQDFTVKALVNRPMRSDVDK
ncbi:DUF1835 domain-containing protein [Desulfogranum marinum]|uniref:DUF1835 domain-containing protein n=1 Tax=Desulfogranum marinum TaxID=453220 RepID=UPI001963ED29|nr:DUF1835 domain-containing protein [Desulfogranum marinum]MBM9513343.1 hypothetical protein [Desulfogranum marinum]